MLIWTPSPGSMRRSWTRRTPAPSPIPTGSGAGIPPGTPPVRPLRRALSGCWRRRARSAAVSTSTESSSRNTAKSPGPSPPPRKRWGSSTPWSSAPACPAGGWPGGWWTSVLCFTSVRLCFYAAQARSFHRKVTIWARVQWASGLKVLALVPAVMFSFTAQATACA